MATTDEHDAAELRAQLVEIVRTRGLTERDEPFRLTSGALSRHFVDGKRALARGSDLALAGRAIVATVAEAGIDFDAAGGLTMGADHLAHAVALVSGCRWFSVRKAVKDHGTAQRVEGAVLDGESRVLLLDDVVTTGGSIGQACDAVAETGAVVVAAVTLLDRGETARERFRARDIPYLPLAVSADLGIDRVT